MFRILFPIAIYIVGMWVTSYVVGRFTKMDDDSNMLWVLFFWPFMRLGTLLFFLGKYLIATPLKFLVDRMEAAFLLGRSRRKQLELRERP